LAFAVSHGVIAWDELSRRKQFGDLGRHFRFKYSHGTFRRHLQNVLLLGAAQVSLCSAIIQFADRYGYGDDAGAHCGMIGQLALYVERGIKPRRIDHVTRISLAIFSRFFN
jgi:hypothetical protein